MDLELRQILAGFGGWRLEIKNQRLVEDVAGDGMP
jgi:hypothetical protein